MQILSFAVSNPLRAGSPLPGHVEGIISQPWAERDAEALSHSQQMEAKDRRYLRVCPAVPTKHARSGIVLVTWYSDGDLVT